MEEIENEYGYGRISAKDQNEARQIKALLDYGIEERNIFIDKKSGKNFEREEYQVLKQILKRTKNNLLVIKSIDRLRKELQRNPKGMARTNRIYRLENLRYAFIRYYTTQRLIRNIH